MLKKHVDEGGPGDLVCDDTMDGAALSRALATPGAVVRLAAGAYVLEPGEIRPAAGVTLTGAGPGVTLFSAPKGPCRFVILEDGVTLQGFSGQGYVGIENHASRFTCEEVELCHSLDGRSYLPFGRHGGCTAAFMNWGRDGQTLTDLTYRRCIARMAYHHGFSCNTTGPGAATFQRVIYEDCQAIGCGSGQEGGGAADWSCGYDLIDTGHLLGLTVRRCRAIDSYQSGFHTDGSWEGHEQRTANLIFEDCVSEGNGIRSGTVPTELYQNGYYLQDHVTLRRCTARRNRKAGFQFKNEVASSVMMEDCSDRESAYGLVIEYGGGGFVTRNFTSTGATRRALQATASGADLEVAIVNFAGTGRPVMLGITERLEFVDAPAHGADLAWYRGISRPFSGSLALRVQAAARVSDLVEVHPPSASAVDLSGVTVRLLEQRPPLPPAPLIDDHPIRGSVSLNLADGEVEIYDLVRRVV